MTVFESLSTKEKDAIKELQRRTKGLISPDLENDNFLYYRFLKARDFNLDLAELMLKKSIAWRKEWNVDDILNDYEPKEAMAKYGPGSNSILGLDKEGSPLIYCACGKIDPRGMRKSVKYIDMVKFVIHLVEKQRLILKRQSKVLGKSVGSVFIMDFGGLSFSVASDKKMLEMLIYVFKMYLDNYPECLKRAYMINVSSYFTFGFNIMKYIFPDSVINKIQICTDNYRKELLETIDASVLPAFLGGTRTDPDGNPMCNSIVTHAGQIPEKYFVRQDNTSLMKNPNAKKLVVQRASFSEVLLEVGTTGSFIEWEFETKTRDIGFGLFFRNEINGQEHVEELVPLTRLETEDFSQTGIHKCEKPGTYVVLFDNTYSWIRSKEIYYRVVISKPPDLSENDIKIL